MHANLAHRNCFSSAWVRAHAIAVHGIPCDTCWVFFCNVFIVLLFTYFNGIKFRGD